MTAIVIVAILALLGTALWQANVARLGPFGTATMGVLAGIAQHAMEAGLARQIDPLVGQARHDLGRRQVGKARFVGDGYKMFALGRAEGMGRRGTFGLRARIGHDHAIGILPALPGTGADARFPAGCRQARTRITRLGDLIHHPLALFPGGHASASLG